MRYGIKMKKTQKLNWLLLIIFALILLGCTFPEEPEINRPEVSIINPPDSAVVGDSVLLSVEASDDNQVSRVEFYINDKLDTNSILYEAPYQYSWEIPDSISITENIKIYAKAYDDQDLKMISNFVRVNYKWKHLADDDDEKFNRNIERLFVRESEDSIEFNVGLYEGWQNYADSSLFGLNCGIFIDIDADSTTGLSHAIDVADSIPPVNLSEAIQQQVDSTIGVDIALVAGFEGNAIWSWDNNSTKWDNLESLEYLHLENDTNQFEIGLPLDLFDQYAESDDIDIITINMNFAPDTVFVDRVPDRGDITYDKNSAIYVGN